MFLVVVMLVVMVVVLVEVMVMVVMEVVLKQGDGEWRVASFAPHRAAN